MGTSSFNNLCRALEQRWQIRYSWLVALALVFFLVIGQFLTALPASATVLKTTLPRPQVASSGSSSSVIDPASTVLWQLGKNDNSAAEFAAYQTVNPENVTVPSDWSTRTDWSFMSEGLDAADNPAMQINYTLNSVPQYGVMFAVHILDAYESMPQMSVFSNGIMVGLIQIAGMNGTGSTYPYEKLYRVYIPTQFLNAGSNVLRLEATNCIWCSSSENQYLWWKWDYLQLAALDAPATEPLNGRYTNLGTSIVKNQFTYDQDTLRMAPYAMKWLGIAYSGNTIRSSFWTDTTSSWQPNATAWLQMLRDYNMQTVVDHINGGLIGNSLNADGTLPQAVQTEYTNFFKTYGSLMQYYELDNEPGYGGSQQAGWPLANEVAMAQWLHNNLPTLAPNVQLVAPGWSYSPTGGTPSGWERDPASRWQVEQYTALTNGHAYNTEEGGRGLSFLENLLTYGNQGLLTGDGLPKPMLTTEVGAYDYTTDDSRFGADPNHTNSAAWDRLLRGQIGYADSIDQHAAFSFNDQNMMQDNWSNDPFSTQEWPAVTNDDPRMDTERRLALAYATHGAPLTYTYNNVSAVQNQHVYFRAVNTATLAPLAGSGGTSTKILLNFVNFNHEGTAPVTMNVQVQMPQAGVYSGERFGAGTTYDQAHSYVRNLQGPTLNLSETLAPGQSVQYILDTQAPLTAPSAPTNVTAKPGNTEAQISWWNASTPATANVTYNVQRAIDGPQPSYTTIATGVTGTSYVDHNINNGTKYDYEISAVNAAGESPYSIAASTTPWNDIRYEAESGVLTGGASIQSDSFASGGAVVGNMHIGGATVTLNNVDGGPSGGTATLLIHYAQGNTTTSTKGLLINGQRVAQLSFASTGAWSGSASAYATLTTTVKLNSDFNNTIALTNNSGAGDQGGVNIDYMELITSYPGQQLFYDDFESGNANQWAPYDGSWSVCQVGSNSKEYCGSNTTENISLAGSSWANYSVQAYIVASSSGNAGICILGRVQDGSHFYQAELKSGNTWDIWKNDGGSWSQIASGTFNWSANTYYLVRFNMNGSTLTMSYSTDNGNTWATLGSGTDGTWSSGKVGVRVWGTTGRFDQMKVLAD
ncbi:FN3 and CBM6-CBM35-CBM36_like domain-containing protein [Ktedonobacteria bacterium brp13]|nr:FN3 and CBM6-CBM35-CBM36_like domain-containing protein [Ktedonobacteria bacterium brp13]